jgi:hypothetical protein
MLSAQATSPYRVAYHTDVSSLFPLLVNPAFSCHAISANSFPLSLACMFSLLKELTSLFEYS